MRRRLVLAASAALTILSAACEDKPKEQAATTTPSAQPVAKAAVSASAPATASASAAVAAKDAPPPAGATRFALFMGKGSFLINAPLEKIKGKSDEVMGHIDVDPKDIGKARGEIAIRLSTLKTNTFGEMDKDAAQTEHARNWMEVGNESAPEARMKFEWAKFTVASVEATPAALADAKEENGARKVKAKVTGDLVIHGITSHKTVPVTVTFKGPADAPTDLTLKFDDPMPVSLKEHDVKPRDNVGSFLNGALERIGKKIDDKVQVSFEGDGKAEMPAHP
jgi:polyisoprenoid-binding protein YceI